MPVLQLKRSGAITLQLEIVAATIVDGIKALLSR
jgi:hypothetical protein